MKLSRNEIFDLMKKEVSDELLLAIKKEKDILFREMTKHRNIAYSIGEHVQTYNRILNKHEKRLTNLLTNDDQ
jgi:DNA invertase Pin-like site-specific DNA recombinase